MCKYQKLLVAIYVCLIILSDMGDVHSFMRIKNPDKAPDFKLENINSANRDYVSLSEYVGETSKDKKIVLIDFISSNCDLCFKELPMLIELNSKWANKGFQLIIIVLEPSDIEQIKKYIKGYRIDCPVLLDNNYNIRFQKVFSADVNNVKPLDKLPLLVFIDHKVNIRYMHVGDYTPNENELPYVVDDLVKELNRKVVPNSNKYINKDSGL